MTLTVRSATVTGATTKGSPLTHAELDANFAHVIDSANQSFTPSGSGAVSRTAQAKMRERVSPEDFGAVGDGTTDDSAAFVLAITARNGKALYLTPGVTYRVDTLGNTTWTTIPVNLEGAGTLDGGSSTTSGFLFGNGVTSIRSVGVTYQNFSAPVMKSSASGNTIDEVTFINNTVTTCQKGLYLLATVKKAIVTDNRFATLSHTLDLAAIHLGNNLNAQQDNMEKFIIIGNEINSVVSSGNSEEAHGIICYGREAIIKGNIIDGVSNGNSTNCEAIYTKCRFSTIEGNTITNCQGGSATNSANIAIKGEIRSGSGSPQGFAVQVRGNTLYSGTGAFSAIRIEQEDVIVEGNYIEGFGAPGSSIYTASGTFNNVNIRNNVIREHRGTIAIQTQHIGTGLSITGNKIYNMPGNQASIAEVWGIRSTNSSGAQNDWNISNNEVYDDGNSAATARITGISVAVSGTRTLNRLRVCGNKVSNAHASITERGFEYSISGTLTDMQVTGNDFSGVPTSGGTPIYDNGVFSTISGKVDISNNTGWGPVLVLANAPSSIESHHCGTTFTNDGFSQARTTTLPVAAPGLWYRFVAVDDFDLIIDPDGTDTITGGTAGQTLSLDTKGDAVELRCFIANEWEIMSSNGTLAFV